MKSTGNSLARDKATQLTELLAMLEADENTSDAAKQIGATLVEGGNFVELPLNNDGDSKLAVNCSGCGCACFSFGGAGHGCGTHAGHWA